MKKRDIREEIRGFQKIKNWIALPLIALGLLGLILPIIPGLALLAAGVLLLFPSQGPKWIAGIKQYMRSIFMRFGRGGPSED